jgi:N-acetylglucosamine-6-phosphate deacetylase
VTAATTSVTRIRDVGLVGREDEGPFVIDIADGRIVAITPASAARASAVRSPDPPSVVEGAGLLAAPGFIELQVNGAAGHDLTADPTSIWAVGEAIVRHGVTTFLPTIVTSPREVVEAGRRALLAGPPVGYRGATPLGLHVEGPFIAAERIGAHDITHRRDPEPVFVAGWSPEAGVRIVTLAPELPGAIELIRELVGRGIVVSIGHTASTAVQARAGFDAGARFVTHLFNAMPGLDHREPGPVGAALADPRVTVGLIPDGLHVDPLVVDVAWRRAGPGRLAIVTDAIAALGMAPGSYHLGTMDVVVDVTSARLADGRLAGSVLSLDAAVRNLRAFTGASVADAVGAVTSTPARLLGLAGERGVLREGAAGDVVMLTPELDVVATVIGGRVGYEAEALA